MSVENPRERYEYFGSSGPLPPREQIPDQCNRRQMTWKQFIEHIRRCPNKHCREVLRNHMELVEQYRLGG
jgi:hypothetical protein